MVIWELKMRNIAFILIILQLVACVSTKNVAETRNSEFAAYNNFELFKFWHELDIQRFKNNLLKVRIALVPENKTIDNFKSDSQMVQVYDTLQVMIGEKLIGFHNLKKMYFDTTDRGKLKLFQNLKSDSADNIFLNKIADNPYYELYKDIIERLRKSILQSTFYTSQDNFEFYIQNRSIDIVNVNTFNDIFRDDKLSLENLLKSRLKTIIQNQIDFIISFSGSYNVDYSDRARSYIGSETIHLNLYDVSSAEQISTANITYFWGSE
jgi:hypothetical protein